MTSAKEDGVPAPVQPEVVAAKMQAAFYVALQEAMSRGGAEEARRCFQLYGGEALRMLVQVGAHCCWPR
jgi:hypothetical protein